MVNITKVGVSVGVGVVDEVLEYWDTKSGRVGSFKTATDVGRLVLAGLGYVLQIWMPRQAELGETLAIAATPLVVKSIAKPIRAAVAGNVGYSFTPRRATSPVGAYSAYQPIFPKPELS